MKLELLTNATVVSDAVKFVSCNSNKKVISKQEKNKESKEEPEYDGIDSSDKQGEENQVEQTGEMTTINKFSKLYSIKSSDLSTNVNI